MATVNAAREEFEAAKTRIAALRAAGKVAEEAVIRVLVILLDIIIVVLLEKTTHEPELRSAAVTDGQGRERAGSNGKGPKPNRQMGDNLRKTIVEETVAACDACGADIDGPVDRERRVLYDIVFEVVERRAEIKECPKCKARGRFPDNMPGPVQYGIGIQALVINLLVAQMLSLRRAVAFVQAVSGIKLSEATCLGYAFTMRHGRRPPWRTSCNARCR